MCVVLIKDICSLEKREARRAVLKRCLRADGKWRTRPPLSSARRSRRSNAMLREETGWDCVHIGVDGKICALDMIAWKVD